MRRLLCIVVVLLLLAVPLSSCDLSRPTGFSEDYKSGLEDGRYEGLLSGYDEGYEYGYEVGHSDGYVEGYDEGHTDGWDSFLYDDFQDYWEDWLVLEYGITEQELCVLLGIPTDTPKPTATPSPSPSPSPTPMPTPTPKPTAFGVGTRGDDVLKLQKRLGILGYSCGTPDGIYGQMTASAVTEFQKVVGLNATGIADANTVKVLFLSNAPTARPDPTLPPEYWRTSTPKPTPKKTATPRPTATPEPEVRYIGNRNTDKFHYTWCSSVDQMKSSNKVYFYYRSEATSRGYVPCQRCEP